MINYSEITNPNLFRYLFNTQYNNGTSTNVSISTGGGSISSVYGEMLLYQTKDGLWRLKYNSYIGVSSTARTQIEFAVSGITAVSSGWYIISAGVGAVIAVNSYIRPSTSNIMCVEHASASYTNYTFYGDIMITSKPAWAY